jgi:hypothetical protein
MTRTNEWMSSPTRTERKAPHLKQQLRNYRWIIFWVLVTALITSFDWPLGVLSEFWQRYAFANSVVSSLIMFALGLFAIEAWLKRREAKRWNQVAFIAAKELGFVTDVLLGGMDYLLTARRSDGDGLDAHANYHERLARCLSKYNYDWNEKVSARAKLNVLISNPEWVSFAILFLDLLKHQHRRDIATWVPVVHTAEGLVKLVNDSAEANQAIFRLQDILRTIADNKNARYAPDDVAKLAFNLSALKVKAEEQWHATHTAIVALQEACMRTAEMSNWKHPHIQFAAKPADRA